MARVVIATAILLSARLPTDAVKRTSLRATAGEDIYTKTYQLANSPYVVGRHGGENREASVERAARKRDADSEPLDRLNLGGLGMHDGEEDAVQNAGDYSFLQAKSRTREDILTKTYQLANSPFVV